MASNRPHTKNYNWPLLFPQGNQIVEIGVLDDTLKEIDADVHTLAEKVSNFKVSFRNIQDKPDTLAGYGIVDAYTSKQTDDAIKAGAKAIKGNVPAGLSTLEALAKAIANDRTFSDTVAAALAHRVSVAEQQSFKLAEKKQARDNIEALGTVDKGAAGGVAPLDTSSKVPSVFLPSLTTTGTVGAAVAAANAKPTPADGDFFAGVGAGGSTMFKTTWSNIKTALSAIFYSKTEINNIVAGNMAGNAFPRRSDGHPVQLQWNGQPGQPQWVWGGTGPEGDNGIYRVWNPAGFSVNYANSAGNANSVGGQTQPAIWAQIENRARDFADDRLNQARAHTEDRSYWRTRDYLLAEHIPVGGYAFLRAANGVKVNPGQYVGGNALGWSNGNHDYVGPINFGTWQLCGWLRGTDAGEDQTTVWKRTA